jgi:hypothetical protein
MALLALVNPLRVACSGGSIAIQTAAAGESPGAEPLVQEHW